MEERMGEGIGRPRNPIESDLREGASRVSHLVDDAKQKGAHLIDDAKQKGANLIGNVKEKVVHGAENLKTKSFEDISHDVRNYVTSKPGRVILASFVIGLIVGSMVRGGRGRG